MAAGRYNTTHSLCQHCTRWSWTVSFTLRPTCERASRRSTGCMGSRMDPKWNQPAVKKSSPSVPRIESQLPGVSPAVRSPYWYLSRTSVYSSRLPAR